MKRTSGRKGFTLAEILISLLILGVVMSAVVTLFFSVFESYQFHQDVMEAKQRGQIALSAIQPYILSAALGIPDDKADFQNAFTQDTANAATNVKTARAIIPVAVNQQFTAPVQLASGDVVTSDDVTSASALWLVYAVPSGVGVEDEYDVSATQQTIPLNKALSATMAKEDTETLKSWITFPANTAPLYISDKDAVADLYEVQTAKSNQKIFAFQEVHYVRAVKIKVSPDPITGVKALRVAHLLDAGTGTFQPIVDGVEGLWCTYDRKGDRVLKVTILARGDTLHTSQLQSSIEGWPSEAPQPVEKRYRYATVTRSWRIRN